MGVLGNIEIESRLKDNPPGHVTTLVITPRPISIDTDSIDLRLGTRFVLPRAHQLESYEYGNVDKAASFQELIHVPLGEAVIVPAHATVLGATLEYIKLPYDVAGQVLTRSSLARIFVSIAAAPWIHPLWRGCLTLEIANASNVPIKLKAGDAVGQLVLFKVECAVRPSDGDRLDKYLRPVWPELPPSSAE